MRLSSLFFTVTASAVLWAVPAPAAEKPNIVLIMCDDLGWGDVGFNGSTKIQTPQLDEMAENGLVLERFYAQCPVCSPTRASVVTGRHHDRTAIPTANQGHLREGEFTIYEALSDIGYRTGHFGKWHMGTLTRETKDANRGGPKGVENYSPPWQHGVEVTFATESKTPTYDPMWKPAAGATKDNFDGASGSGWNVLGDRERTPYDTHYWTAEETMIDPTSDSLLGDDSKVIMDRTIPFIQSAAEAEEPFIAIVWFHAPHLPCVASVEDAALYDDGEATEFEQNYRGCVTAIDREVGRLRASLRELGIAEDTIVTFCSDNGPEGKDGAPGEQGHFTGRKRSLREGGVRVPSLIEWPAEITAGTRSTTTTCTVDYFPTLMEVCGFEMPDERPVDGFSLVPLFTTPESERPKPLGFFYRGQAAWHDGLYKIYRTNNNGAWQLHHLGDDPSEKNDLAKAQPERLQKMTEAWAEWKASVESSEAGNDY